VALSLAFSPTMVTIAGALAAFLTLASVIGAGVWLGPRLLVSARWHRPIRLLPDPVPPTWAAIIRENVPISRQLRDDDFERLLKLAQAFLARKHVEGAGGFEVTEEARVTIAAQACLLLLWRNTGLYPGLRTVIVYPGSVVPRYADRESRWAEDPPEPVLGQSWQQGVVILSWDGARRGAFDPRDGHNVVFHEFAHQLDQESGTSDGLPVGVPLSSLKPWAEVMERRFRQLRKAARRGSETVLDTYGATNPAEFFAVATEAFFEKPKELRAKKPDLYALLVEFYGVDAASGLQPLTVGDSATESRGARRFPR